MEHIQPVTLEELKAKRKAILKELTKKNNSTLLSKIAVWITEHVGSMTFFLIIFVWTTGWLSWNMLAPKAARFDPYPAFVLWLFISNMIQLFLMPLIMLGQNIQSKQAEIRSEVDLKINAQAELENEAILMHLENQNDFMIKLMKKLDKQSDNK
ncbi:MAG: hypothetical protein NVS3B19_17400 [Ginsengibacter sp.]